MFSCFVVFRVACVIFFFQDFIKLKVNLFLQVTRFLPYIHISRRIREPHFSKRLFQEKCKIFRIYIYQLNKTTIVYGGAAVLLGKFDPQQTVSRIVINQFLQVWLLRNAACIYIADASIRFRLQFPAAKYTLLCLYSYAHQSARYRNRASANA